MPTDRPSDEYDTNDTNLGTSVAEAGPTEPGKETFWKSYNRHLEFPIATLLSLFAHLILVAGLIGIILLMMAKSKDAAPVPISLVDNGPDDAGQGNPNEGGEIKPITNGDNAPTHADRDQLPNLEQLQEIKDEIQKDIALDPTLADVKVPDEKVAPLAGLAEDLQKKLSQFGKPKGAGGAGPAGPGGSGSDSTRARSLRWILRFNDINTGRDYLDRLASLGAVVMMPIPPANKTGYIYKNLSSKEAGTVMTDGEWLQLSQKVQFCEYKQDLVKQVTRELRNPTVPHAFWVFFPKSLEEKLSEMEKAHQGKRSDEIEETVFQVVLKNGLYDMVVVRQTLKN